MQSRLRVVYSPFLLSLSLLLVYPRDAYTHVRARKFTRGEAGAPSPSLIPHPADTLTRVYGKRVIVWEFSDPRLMRRLGEEGRHRAELKHTTPSRGEKA